MTNVVKFEGKKNKTLRESLRELYKACGEELDNEMEAVVWCLLPKNSNDVGCLESVGRKGVDTITVIGLLEFCKNILMTVELEGLADDED